MSILVPDSDPSLWTSTGDDQGGSGVILSTRLSTPLSTSAPIPSAPPAAVLDQDTFGEGESWDGGSAIPATPLVAIPLDPGTCITALCTPGRLVPAMTAVVTSLAPVRRVTTRSGSDCDVATMTVADPSTAKFPVTLWAHHARLDVQPGDVVLLTQLRTTTFRGQVQGSTTRASTIDVLPRDNNALAAWRDRELPWTRDVMGTVTQHQCHNPSTRRRSPRVRGGGRKRGRLELDPPTASGARPAALAPPGGSSTDVVLYSAELASYTHQVVNVMGRLGVGDITLADGVIVPLQLNAIHSAGLHGITVVDNVLASASGTIVKLHAVLVKQAFGDKVSELHGTPNTRCEPVLASDDRITLFKEHGHRGRRARSQVRKLVYDICDVLRVRGRHKIHLVASIDTRAVAQHDSDSARWQAFIDVATDHDSSRRGDARALLPVERLYCCCQGAVVLGSDGTVYPCSTCPEPKGPPAPRGSPCYLSFVPFPIRILSQASLDPVRSLQCHLSPTCLSTLARGLTPEQAARAEPGVELLARTLQAFQQHTAPLHWYLTCDIDINDDGIVTEQSLTVTALTLLASSQ